MSRPRAALGHALAGVLGLIAAGQADARTGQPAFPPFLQNAASLAETARAEAIIARDPKTLTGVGLLCRPLPEIFAVGGAIKTPPASRAFDNLYYLGLGGVGAWAIDTRDGIILLDALDDAEEAKTYIEGGLRSLGLDPARLKYVVISHGHFDHFGGAKYLQDKYHARILMSPADWDLMAATPSLANGRPAPEPPAHDMDVHDGQRLTLGETTITLYITPGHTAGTVSAIIPVQDHARTRVLSFLGGTAFPGDVSLLAKYRVSVARFAKIARAAGAAGVISNHPVFDDSVERLAEIAAHPAAPNPFLIGPAALGRCYEVLGHCLEAQIDRQKPAV